MKALDIFLNAIGYTVLVTGVGVMVYLIFVAMASS
jgi:hypothetical protein|tara:strand:+ start:452 stop:556 length:105 start_codon:yes stop_codon:yes gene_type:complete